MIWESNESVASSNVKWGHGLNVWIRGHCESLLAMCVIEEVCVLRSRVLFLLGLVVVVAACGEEPAVVGGPASGASDMRVDAEDMKMAAAVSDMEESEPAPDLGGSDGADMGAGARDMGAGQPEPDMRVEPEDMKAPAQGVYVGVGDVFSEGALAVASVDVDAGGGPGVDTKVWYPTAGGSYPVVFFQHGFLMANTHYSELIEHVASHGFIVVAGQMYDAGGLPIGKPSAAEEATSARALWAWGRSSVSSVLPAGVEPWGEQIGVIGHSRGGKVSWLLFEGGVDGVAAFVGLDPVDGTGGPLGGEARAVMGAATRMGATLIIGTGLGGESSGPLAPACAPSGDNHEEFYGAALAPAYHIVATSYGHNDMLDDSPAGCGFECTACPAGDARAPMRSASAGWSVALLREALQGGEATGVLSGQAAAPVGATFESR